MAENRTLSEAQIELARTRKQARAAYREIYEARAERDNRRAIEASERYAELALRVVDLAARVVQLGGRAHVG